VVSSKLYQVPFVNRVTVVEDKNERVTVLVFPKANAPADSDLARAVGEAAHGWQIEQLKVEEGRLDEVFRSITMSDTAKEEKK